MADEADKFVEIDGVKYKEDPENEGQVLIGDNEKPVPFEEKEENENEESPEEKEAREKKEQEALDNEEPPTRKSAKDYIIERKNKKIEKLKEKKDNGEEDPTEEDEESKNLSKKIKEQVEGAMKPVLDTVRSQSDEKELKEVFTKYPDAEKMEKQIRKYMDSPAYKQASVEFIYLGLAAKKMELQKKRDKADEDAKGDRTGGHGKRKPKISPLPDVRDFDDKQMDELIGKVKTGQFK